MTGCKCTGDADLGLCINSGGRFLGVYHIIVFGLVVQFFFFSSRRRHTRFKCDWSSDVCSSDLAQDKIALGRAREKLGHARWTLERAARKFYAPDSTTINNTVVIGDPSQVRQEIAVLEERLGLEATVDNSAYPVHEPSPDQHTHVM